MDYIIKREYENINISKLFTEENSRQVLPETKLELLFNFKGLIRSLLKPMHILLNNSSVEFPPVGTLCHKE